MLVEEDLAAGSRLLAAYIRISRDESANASSQDYFPETWPFEGLPPILAEQVLNTHYLHDGVKR